MRKHYALIVAGLFHAGLLSAQDSLGTTYLDEVVTTGRRSEQAIIETPRSATVISRDVIEKSIYNSVGELLSKQSGIYIVGANQTPGTNQSLFMRGANSNQVAVLIDGARITDPSSPNATIDLSELSLTDIERIEIIRGSHSTLYGGSAVGGVVNIITKKAQKTGAHAVAELQAGTFGKAASLSENIGVNYTIKSGLYINASLFNQNVHGLNSSIDTLKSNGPYATADKDNFKKTDAYVKAGFKTEAWDIFTSYKKIRQSADLDDGIYNDDDNAYLDFERNLLNYQLGYKIANNWRLTVLGSWSDSHRHSVNDSSINNENGDFDATYVEGKYNGKILTNELQLNYRYQTIKGVVGAGQYSEDMSFNTYYFNRSVFGEFESKVNYDTIDTSAKTRYVFAQINLTKKNFNFSLGSRFSDHSRFGTSWTFEASPSIYFGNTLLYASVSSGFNPPSLYQLYDPTQGFGAYNTRGNRELEPETSVSVELGVKKEFESGSYLTISAHHTRTKNSIEYVYLWAKDTPIQALTFADNLGDRYLNMANQRVNGVELDGHLIYKKFYLHGNLTWIDGEVTVDPSDINVTQTGGNHVQLFNYGSFVTEAVKINKLIRRPRVVTNAALGYKPLATLDFTVSYRYAGSRFDSGYDADLGPYGALNQVEVEYYNLIDFAVNWMATKSFSVGLKIENMLDEGYQEIIGFQTRGRSAYLKLNFRW
jgi:vitamin B12 transporter